MLGDEQMSKGWTNVSGIVEQRVEYWLIFWDFGNVYGLNILNTKMSNTNYSQ